MQKWGNSLTLRIPAAIAHSAHFHLGTIVELDAHDGSLVAKATGRRKLSLNDRLSAFNPEQHGGEVMPVEPISVEKL